MGKLKPSTQISNELIQLLLESRNNSENIISELIRKTLKKEIQLILEEEVKSYLGRDYYQRIESPENKQGNRQDHDDYDSNDSALTYEKSAKPIYRNGYENYTIKTQVGKIPIDVPQLRNTDEPYRSVFMQNNKRICPEFEKMITQMYLRGCSTRDLEKVLVDQTGSPILSRSSVSMINQSLQREYEEFSTRDLSDLDVVYLFVDGVYESMRKQKSRKEAILCAWEILSDGTKQMLHLSLGNKENTQTWKEFFRHMLDRGLREPLLIISDGSTGLKKAISEVLTTTKHQRCIAHKLRNIANKLPDEHRSRVLEKIRNVYYQTNKEVAETLASKVVEEYSKVFSSAIKCFQEDFQSCIRFIEFPESHHKFIRTTNTLERAFEEQKRRTKIIPRFFTEDSCMNLVFGTLIMISSEWKSIKMSHYDKTILKNIRNI